MRRIGDSRPVRRPTGLGVPIAFPEEPDQGEVTDPIDLWTRGVYTEAERHVIDELGLDPDRPVPLGQLVKVMVQIREEKERRRKSDTDRQRVQTHLADQVLATHQAIRPEHIAEMDRRLAAAERWRKSVNKIVISTVSAAALSLGGIGALLWNRASQEGGNAVRLERLEQDLRRQEHELERAIDQIRAELGRRSELSGPVPLVATTKGPVP